MAWRTAKSLLTLRSQIDIAYPGRSRASDGTIGDPSHQAEKTGSDHNPNMLGVVCALDITHDPANGVDIDKLSDSLAASRDPRIKYLIANGLIMVPADFGWTWQTYTGSNPHTSHLHISVYGDYDNSAEWSINNGGNNMTDENYVRAWFEDLLRVSPTREELKPYLNRPWMEVYNELRSSKARQELLKFYKQVEIDAVERAKRIDQLQAELKKQPVAEAQKELEKLKATLKELSR